MKKLLSILLSLSTFVLFTPSAYASGIAWDAAQTVQPLGSTGLTISNYPTTGTNIYLLVNVSTNTNSVTATYNGVSMTQLDQASPTAPCSRFDTVFGLYVASGVTANIVISGGGTSGIFYAAVSDYTGASSANPDNHNATSRGAETVNVNTITPVAANSWHVAFFETNNTSQTANTGTQRSITNGAFGVYDSNGVVAGSHTISVNQNVSEVCDYSLGVTVKPVAVASNYKWWGSLPF